jgi:hypothetical protein
MVFRTAPLLLAVAAMAAGPEAPPAPKWIANAEIVDAKTFTLEGLGDAQGVSIRGEKLYVYGDVKEPGPRCGVIREYTAEFKPTGKVIWLRQGGKAIILHPTGLTWHPKLGCFLGDTVLGKATIYQLDWDRALTDGTLDAAVLTRIDDDAAINGCRPEFVELEGTPYLATADYGDVHPEVRLLDVGRMLAAKRTSAPGVVARRFLAGPFNQNLAWDADTGRLTCIQNVVAGLGWRLDTLDLAKAVADGRADGPGVRVSRQTFPPGDELEGWRPLGKRAIFVTSAQANNITVGAMRDRAEKPE